MAKIFYVFAGGQPDKVKATQAKFPKAIFCAVEEVPARLKTFVVSVCPENKNYKKLDFVLFFYYIIITKTFKIKTIKALL